MPWVAIPGYHDTGDNPWPGSPELAQALAIAAMPRLVVAPSPTSNPRWVQYAPTVDVSWRPCPG